MTANRQFTVACDFDGTIHDPTNVESGYRMGKPYVGARETLLRLHDLGARIVVHTCRARTPQGVEDGPWIGTSNHVAHWLDYFQIPYDEITALKPVADVYLDDHALPFQGDWADTERELLTLFYLTEGEKT